jgi:hypothetical protein
MDHLWQIGSPTVAAQELSVLREHCDTVGRDYDKIEKTVLSRMDPGNRGERAGVILGDEVGARPDPHFDAGDPRIGRRRQAEAPQRSTGRQRPRSSSD